MMSNIDKFTLQVNGVSVPKALSATAKGLRSSLKRTRERRRSKIDVIESTSKTRNREDVPKSYVDLSKGRKKRRKPRLSKSEDKLADIKPDPETLPVIEPRARSVSMPAPPSMVHNHNLDDEYHCGVPQGQRDAYEAKAGFQKFEMYTKMLSRGNSTSRRNSVSVPFSRRRSRGSSLEPLVSRGVAFTHHGTPRAPVEPSEPVPVPAKLDQGVLDKLFDKFDHLETSLDGRLNDYQDQLREFNGYDERLNELMSAVAQIKDDIADAMKRSKGKPQKESTDRKDAVKTLACHRRMSMTTQEYEKKNILIGGLWSDQSDEEDFFAYPLKRSEDAPEDQTVVEMESEIYIEEEESEPEDNTLWYLILGGAVLGTAAQWLLGGFESNEKIVYLPRVEYKTYYHTNARYWRE